MGKNTMRSGKEDRSLGTVVKKVVNQVRLNPIDSPILNRLHNDLKLKEEIESIEWKFRRR